MRGVLGESAQLLAEKPSIFLPKLLSSLTGSVFIVSLVSGSLNPFHAVLMLPFLGLMGIFSTLIVAHLAVSEREGFIEALSESLKSWKKAVGTVFLFTVAGFLISLPLYAGFLVYYYVGGFWILGAGLLSSLILLVVISAVSYFLPITLLEEETLCDAFKASYTGFSTHSRQVWSLTAFSFLLLLATFAAEGALEKVGYLGFVIGRGLSAVANTYVFVVSPRFYESMT